MKGWRPFIQILQDRIQRGPQRALRDVISAEIATKADLILFETASAQIDDTQDPPLAPDIGWQADLLSKSLATFPRSSEAGLVMFTEARTSPELARRSDKPSPR